MLFKRKKRNPSEWVKRFAFPLPVCVSHMTPPQEKRPSSGLAGMKLASPERTINAGGKIEFQKLVRTISSSVSITKRRQQKPISMGFFISRTKKIPARSKSCGREKVDSLQQ